jgi:hypothetical protein
LSGQSHESDLFAKPVPVSIAPEAQFFPCHAPQQGEWANKKQVGPVAAGCEGWV